MKLIAIFISVSFLLLLSGCNSKRSMQQYFVAHQDDSDFISVDVPTSILNSSTLQMSADDMAVLQRIKKVNLLVLKTKVETQGKFIKEKETVSNIIASDRYETLMKFNKSGVQAHIAYEGEDDAIDEVIVFATDPTKGLAVIRITGNGMNVHDISKLIKKAENSDTNFETYKDLIKIFD